ncbi:flagellar basal body rod protein FlgB [Alphaproteobacteria bacterium]|nr:flagellar basal body rod protein FlgB [Alphaproteobacteria bacterium]
MKGIGDYLQVHSAALSLRSKRNDILASNIANAATPNFKARDINFEDEINRAAGHGSMNGSDARHIRTAVNARPDQVLYRQPLNPSLDGNTVELNVEQMEFSENVIRYQTSLTFLNNRITGLMSAIRGE